MQRLPVSTSFKQQGWHERKLWYGLSTKTVCQLEEIVSRRTQTPVSRLHLHLFIAQSSLAISRFTFRAVWWEETKHLVCLYPGHWLALTVALVSSGSRIAFVQPRPFHVAVWSMRTVLCGVEFLWKVHEEFIHFRCYDVDQMFCAFQGSSKAYHHRKGGTPRHAKGREKLRGCSL